MNFPMEEEEQVPAEGGEDFAGLDDEVLEELMAFAKGGMAKGISERNAPPAPVDVPAEEEPIPGVEPESAEPDVEKLKALLASMKG